MRPRSPRHTARVASAPSDSVAAVLECTCGALTCHVMPKAEADEWARELTTHKWGRSLTLHSLRGGAP